MLKINKTNYSRIKITGTCPRCGGKLEIGSWEYINEPNTRQYLPLCTNEKCDEHHGYGNSINYRFVNHNRIKIQGLFD